MPTFAYKAKELTGKNKTGVLVARNKEDVVASLRQQNLFVISVQESTEKQHLTFLSQAGRINAEQLALFFRQLSTLVNAGIPLTKGLTILSGQFKNRELRRIAASLCSNIEAGISLSEALANYPRVFSPLHINMVSAGENSGALTEILQRIAVYIEKNNSLIRRVKSAMVYPAAIVIVAVLVTSFLIFKVLPGFKEMFESLGGSLPLPTQLLINFSDFCRKYFLVAAVFLVAIFVVIARYINTSTGRVKFSEFKLNIPLFGSLIQKLTIARFSHTLATLLKSGIPILSALDIVAKTVGNDVVEMAILRVKEQVSRGERLVVQLGKEVVFPQMAVEMIGVGEEAGELEEMLGKIGSFYEEQVDITVGSLMSMIEPFIIIFLGVVVGSIVVAMFLPVLKITQLVGGR